MDLTHTQAVQIADILRSKFSNTQLQRQLYLFQVDLWTHNHKMETHLIR